MSRLYLIRHGQAGPRGSYDALSELGRTQARLLGEYLVRQRVAFTAVYCGALARQQQTAQELYRAYQSAGLPLPEMIVDSRWNEFDLSGVFNALAPYLCADDPIFKAEFEEMRRAPEREAEPQRRWTRCDTEAVRAWIEARYPFEGESWRAFCSRVSLCREMLGRHGAGEAVAVFTSATPIALWVGMALEAPESKVMDLAGALYNSAITTLRMRDGRLSLFSFNTVPHLADPHLITFR